MTPFLLVFAYIDPSTGGVIAQALAAIAVAVSGAFFFFSNQLKTMWARLRRSSRNDSEQDPTDDA